MVYVQNIYIKYVYDDRIPMRLQQENVGLLSFQN